MGGRQKQEHVLAHNIPWCKFNSAVNYKVPKQLILQNPHTNYLHKCRPLFSRYAAWALGLLHNVELRLACCNPSKRRFENHNQLQKTKLLFWLGLLFWLSIQLQSSSESWRNFLGTDLWDSNLWQLEPFTSSLNIPSSS